MVPSRNSIIPDFHHARPKSALLAKPGTARLGGQFGLVLRSLAGSLKKRLRQSLKLLVCRLKFRVAVMDDFRRSAPKRLFRRDAVQPSLFGKLFVRRKIQPHQQADSPVGHRRRFFSSGSARFRGSRFAFGFFRRFSFGFGRCRLSRWLGFARSLDTRAVGTIQLVLQLLVEAKSLPPPVELVPRLLRLLLVGAKIKSYVTVCHESSLRRRAIQVKLEGPYGLRSGHDQRVYVTDFRDWRIV